MIKLLRLGLALAVTTLIVIGQTPPKDVDGWGKIKWGMTLQEARAAYQSDAQPDDSDYWASQRLPSVKIGDINMDAEAMAKHGFERVMRVKLYWIFYERSDGPSGASGFDTLRTLLIQKYGPVVSDEKKTEYGDPVHAVLWTFPSTSILLKLTRVAVTIDYTATDKKALDVL